MGIVIVTFLNYHHLQPMYAFQWHDEAMNPISTKITM